MVYPYGPNVRVGKISNSKKIAYALSIRKLMSIIVRS